MSFNFSSLKWGWVVVGTIVGFLAGALLNLIIQFGYGLVLGFQLRGSPPQEVLIAAFSTLPFLLLAVVMTFLGGLIGGRMAARRSEDNPLLAGLVTGLLVAILVAVWRAISWSPDLWMVLGGISAFAGGWLGGWLVHHRAAEEPQVAYGQ